MKFNKISKLLILTLLMAVTISALYGANIAEVEQIEFKGLKNLSKYQVISNVKPRAVKNGINIDLDLLEKSLKSNKLIDTFKVVKKNNKLIINIKEKEIFISQLLQNQFATVANDQLILTTKGFLLADQFATELFL